MAGEHASGVCEPEGRMKQSFFIPGPLPGMNDFVRKHPMVYSRLKRDWSLIIGGIIRRHRIKAMVYAAVSFDWREPNQRRDPDNIMAGQKFILDQLVATKVLRDDGWGEITSLHHAFRQDASNPGVLVTLEGC